ncbi:MAG: hypothetical protein PHS41_08940 [Victivallaceae bacterium]|nr:hypothetical protein [Victivallaceae bacterium]
MNPNEKYINKNSRIQEGIIALSAPKEFMGLLKQFNLPAVSDSATTWCGRVTFDWLDFAARAPAYLAEAGCRRPGVLLSLPEHLDRHGDSFIRYCLRVRERLWEAMAQSGMSPEPERIFSFGSFWPIPEIEYAKAAYQAVQRMASLAEPPDGWFVFADVFNEGALAAMRDNTLLPAPLLVHVNKGVEQLLPAPRIEAVSDLDLQAERMIDDLLSQFHGGKPSSVELPLDLRVIDSEML